MSECLEIKIKIDTSRITKSLKNEEIIAKHITNLLNEVGLEAEVVHVCEWSIKIKDKKYFIALTGSRESNKSIKEVKDVK